MEYFLSCVLVFLFEGASNKTIFLFVFDATLSLIFCSRRVFLSSICNETALSLTIVDVGDRLMFGSLVEKRLELPFVPMSQQP